MGLTRPTAAQLNTVVSTISDPITVLNQGATSANIDVGFIINRNGGTSSNVALFWDESANTFVTAFTSNSGVTNANISISTYANITAGYLFGDGSQLTNVTASASAFPSGDYGDVSTATSDAFGILAATAHDCNVEGVLTYVDFGAVT